MLMPVTMMRIYDLSSIQVHSKGLKLGVYLDTGNTTRNGYPGSENHLQLDAQTLAHWRLDMVKLNGCNTQDPHQYNTGKQQQQQWRWRKSWFQITCVKISITLPEVKKI